MFFIKNANEQDFSQVAASLNRTKARFSSFTEKSRSLRKLWFTSVRQTPLLFFTYSQFTLYFCKIH